MTICDLKRGERAVVLKVDTAPPIRERLRALGICTGAKVTLLKNSLRKKTYLVQAGEGRIALGCELAAGVRVWKM